MNILGHKEYQPLFGCWMITRVLEKEANRALFETEHKGDGHTEKAAIRIVFIPRYRSDVQALMKQLGQEIEPIVFLKKIIDAVKQELLIRQQLKGQPHIVELAEHKINVRSDKTGIEVQMRMEYLTPLKKYLQQQTLTEEMLRRISDDICQALESCHQAGIQHGNVCEDAIFVTSEGTFKLGRFEKAMMTKGEGTEAPNEENVRCATADIRSLGRLLRQLATKANETITPAFDTLIQQLYCTDTSGGNGNPEKIRERLERLTSWQEQPCPVAVELGQPQEKPTPVSCAIPSPVPALPQPPQNTAVLTRQRSVSPQRQKRARELAELCKTQMQLEAQPAIAAEQPQELFDKVSEGYEVSKKRKATVYSRRGKVLVAVVGGVLCLATLGFVGTWFVLPTISDALVAAGNKDTNEALQTMQTLPDADEQATTEEPTFSPEEKEKKEQEQRIQQVLSTMQSLCTGTQPQVTDPATWNEAGRALMDRLEADPYYQGWKFTASAAAFTAGDENQSMRADMTAAIGQWQEETKIPLAEQYPYMIAVNRAASTVTIYVPDEKGRYTVPYMAMVCSGGPNTPTGFWFTPIRYQWRTLVGPCYGQNATRIWNSYLFHSVPYYTQHKDDVEYDQYNQLGTQASLGCIRLAMVDVKWIFDNCPLGTPVVIYDDENDPGPMGKPGTIYTDPANTEMRGWDPTDPDPANPWDDAYLSGTAIRSEAAWEEYKAATADGRWNDTINITDLRGKSTDSTVEGTRG